MISYFSVMDLSQSNRMCTQHYKMNAIKNNCRHHKSAFTNNMSYSSTHKRNAYEASAIIDKVLAMKRRESNEYLCRNYIHDTSFRIGQGDDIEQLRTSWRERICHWTYNVIDHFDLSGATAAISVDLFDRYLVPCNTGNFLR